MKSIIQKIAKVNNTHSLLNHQSKIYDGNNNKEKKMKGKEEKSLTGIYLSFDKRGIGNGV